ncbi:diaminopimelate decarboxylase [Streptomyces chrestomyceticus]|uniref:diaminopimelate decarboxylase n=1 Tax=Streptomyces chrestomyceticus TaxID=68185 RepID=UPI0033C39CA5
MADCFHYDDGVLHCEGASLEKLVRTYGTPSYVYSRATFRTHLAGLKAAFAALDPLVCYAVKTCGNIHLLSEVDASGAGADVVSGGELYRALSAGIPAERVVFAGVGKSDGELREAVEAGIRSVNVESESELSALGRIAARAGRTVRAAVRVNPDVQSRGTPEKTTTGVRGSKFGVDLGQVPALFERAATLPQVALDGLHLHLGSPIHSPEPYVVALERILELTDKLRTAGHTVNSINMGGGFAAAYETGGAPGWDAYAAAIVPVLAPFVASGGQVIMEPGRTIAANAGALLTRVRFIKQAGDRRVAVVDAGMNTLIRAALYDSFHFLWPVRPCDGLVPPHRAGRLHLPGLIRYDIAGPICETTDYLARDRELPPLAEGDLMCIFGAGAYGMAMASQYNATPRPPEILVDEERATLIRRRETYADLIEAELPPPSATSAAR